MYFLIVFLLLLGTDFTCSMRRHRTREQRRETVPNPTEIDLFGDELVPFDTEYADAVQTFIRNGVSGFPDKFTYFMTIINDIQNKIFKPTFPYECKDESDPSVPETLLLPESSLEECKRKCVNLDFHYLSMLEKCISMAIEKIFPNEASHYKIKLFNPIHEISSDCVYSEKRKKFMCSCIVTYRILVSRFLKVAVERAVEIAAATRYEFDIKNDFFTFVLLLKYHPHAAPLYLAYLAYAHELNLKAFSIPQFDLESDVNLNTEISTELLTAGSLTHNKGPILLNEYRIYERLIMLVDEGYWNLENFGYLYLNPFIPITIILHFSFCIFMFIRKIFGTPEHEKDN